jgi:hypothetical protein
LLNICETGRRWMNTLCSLSRTQVYRPFFFDKITIMGHVYLDILDHFLVPQLDVNIVIWQQDGPLPSITGLWQYLDHTFPGRWIGHGGYILWPPRSPNLTPMEF